MSIPTCTVIEAAEMAQLSSTLMWLWVITVIALVVGNIDTWLWENRIRRFFRRRRLQRIRAARLGIRA